MTAAVNLSTTAFQSTPSVGRATGTVRQFGICRTAISIHALRGEGDIQRADALRAGSEFQSTPSVGRATAAQGARQRSRRQFQSTPSVGRATYKSPRVNLRYQHFNPRPPWGGRPRLSPASAVLRLFQSTPSVGRATCAITELISVLRISIHALRGEGDKKANENLSPTLYFNPRPPWGGRPATVLYRDSVTGISIHALRGEGDSDVGKLPGDIIISIHALRGEGDCKLCHPTKSRNISIHALRGEGDPVVCRQLRIFPYFNPRPPWGGRRAPLGSQSGASNISIHALRGEGDKEEISEYLNIKEFQSTPSVGRATPLLRSKPPRGRDFNPRPPWGGRRQG